MKPVALLLLAAGLVAASGSPDVKTVKEEMTKLEGTWVIVTATMNGKSVEGVPGGELVFAGDTLTWRGKDSETRKNKYKIDPSRKPKTIDSTPVPRDEGPGLGIYELDGDTLKMCFGVERPVKFTDKGQLLFSLKRKKLADDQQTIEGNWTVVSREFIGKKTPEAELKALKVIIKDGTITMDDGKKKEKIPYKLDPSKKPKAIDLANTGIENKETTLAIYELDGDTLRICWSEKDPEHRATKFASDKDSGQTMIVLKREKKGK